MQPCRFRCFVIGDLLTVQEVLKLHEVLESENRHVVDRLFCGHMLHLLYMAGHDGQIS